VSHLHYVLFGGSALGIFAATYYWFPKMFGAMLNETLGKVHFVLAIVGTHMTFFPQHLLGLDGMPRRVEDYSPNAGWADLNLLSSIGAFTIGISVIPFFWNIFITLRGPRDAGDDPWDGNTLEWATTSPPPAYNFDRLPRIRSERPLFDIKYGGTDAGGTRRTMAIRAGAQAHGPVVSHPDPTGGHSAGSGETPVEHGRDWGAGPG
jgi:cytochrome c oxidase subunit 1